MTHEYYSSPRLAAFSPPAPRRAEPPTGYGRIVVPIEGASNDDAAVALAIALGGARRAAVTLVQFLPEGGDRGPVRTPPSIGNCLDAFGLLHDACAPAAPARSIKHGGRRVRDARAALEGLIEQRFPATLRSSTRIDIECQIGHAARDLAPLCAAWGAGLVVLSGRASSWWGAPFAARGVRKALRRARIPVAVVHAPVEPATAEPAPQPRAAALAVRGLDAPQQRRRRIR